MGWPSIDWRRSRWGDFRESGREEERERNERERTKTSTISCIYTGCIWVDNYQSLSSPNLKECYWTQTHAIMKALVSFHYMTQSFILLHNFSILYKIEEIVMPHAVLYNKWTTYVRLVFIFIFISFHFQEHIKEYDIEKRKEEKELQFVPSICNTIFNSKGISMTHHRSLKNPIMSVVLPMNG